jgi:HSP20 family protein
MLPVLRNNPLFSPVTAGPLGRLDSLFERFFGDDGAFAGQALSWAPVAMWEDDDHIYVEADLPGVPDSDVDVTVHNGMLIIRGERKPEEGRRYLYNGRPYGRFERVVALPELVNTDDVQATLTDGVLRLTLSKSSEAKPRKITLKTS